MLIPSIKSINIINPDYGHWLLRERQSSKVLGHLIFKGGKGFRRLLFSQQSMGNKDLINIWALWVGKVCNFTPRKSLKLIIERTNLQWLLETLLGFRVNVRFVDYAILTLPCRRDVKRGLVHFHVNHTGSSSCVLPLGWYLGWTDGDFPVWFLWLSLRHHPNFEEIRSERMTHKDEYALADILASLSVGQQP